MSVATWAAGFLLGAVAGVWLAVFAYRLGWTGLWPWQKRRRTPSCASGGSCYAPWGCASPEWQRHRAAPASPPPPRASDQTACSCACARHPGGGCECPCVRHPAEAR